MKNRIFVSAVVLMSALTLPIGCGGPAVDFKLDQEGYGKAILSNGITVLVNHDETTSLTAGRFLIGGGVLTETAENNGITDLMTRMLLKGSEKMNADQISEQLEFLGANVSAACFRDYSAISFQCLTENFEEVFDIISSSLLSPTFPEEELVRLKDEVRGEIKATDDNQSQASSKLLWKTIYGGQGYGLPTLGTLESIENISISDIKKHFQEYVGGNNLIISVASDFAPRQLVSLINQKLKQLKSQAEEIPVPSLALQSEKTGFISYDRNQSFIYMGVALDHLKSEEVPYLFLLNETMGGTVGSRLWFLRQKEKLAYAVYTQYAFDKYDAVFRAAIGTDTTKVKKALNSLDREWEKMVTDGITESELTDAKINMKNTLVFWIDRKSNRANNMAYLEYIGYGYRFVLDLIEMADKITLTDINGFIKNGFSDDRRYVSIVGKQ